MAINVNLYAHFWDDPKIDEVVSALDNVTKGTIRSIYLECLNVMHQGLVDYLHRSKLMCIVFENMQTGKLTARRLQVTCNLIVAQMSKSGLFHYDEINETFHFFAMTKKLPDLLMIKEINRLKGIKSGEMRRNKRTAGSTPVQPGFNPGSTPVELSISESISKEEEYTPAVAGVAGVNLSVTKRTKPKKPSGPPAPFDQFANDFNETVKRFSKISPIDTQNENKTLRKLFKSRWNEFPDYEAWKDIFEIIPRCPLLIGSVSDWKISAAWLLEAKNLEKVRAGTYIGSDKSKPAKEDPNARLFRKAREMQQL